MKKEEISAHLVAKHCRAVAGLVKDLSDEALRKMAPAFDRAEPEELKSLLAVMFERTAKNVEATAPFEPVTEDEMQEAIDELADVISCESTNESFEARTSGWTDAEWRHEVDMLHDYMYTDKEA